MMREWIWKNKYKLGIGIFVLDVIISLYVWITEPLPEARGLIIIHVATYLLSLGVIGLLIIFLYFDEKKEKVELR